ncbi:MAG: response regulator transcription factor [Syntrophaceae bacterium]|nr:response regulator transcription factor [Syntrophaceae bacterium]
MNPNLKVKNEKTRIFIVDDHPIVRQGLTQLINLEEDMTVVGEASDVAEAIQGIAKTKPDLALVDISLKGTSGIELTKNILADHPKMSVLIISMYDESLYVERVLKAGAKGYIMKQEATDHVAAAIRKVLGGDIYVSDKWRNKLVHKFIHGNTAGDGSSPEILSGRELEVLQLVGQGYSTRRIATELHVSVKTVESHYANIKDKLNLKNSHELIQYAVKWSLTEK